MTMMSNVAISELNLREMELVGGGNDDPAPSSTQTSGCDFLAGVGGAILGGIGGFATTAVSGPISGIFVGAVIGAGAATSINNICMGNTTTSTSSGN